ncbi:MAG TPA: hypothetical protein VIL78_15820 [Hanamia sp.]
MKQFPKWIIMYSIFMAILICLPALIQAQCPDAAFDPGCDPITCTRADGSYCPIDGGLSALLAIGVAYGIKKYKDTKKHPEALGESIVE